MRTLLRLIKGKLLLLIKHVESEFCLWPSVWLSVVAQRLRQYILLSPTLTYLILSLSVIWPGDHCSGWLIHLETSLGGGGAYLEAPPLMEVLTGLLICITARPVHFSALELRRNTFSLSFPLSLSTDWMPWHAFNDILNFTLTTTPFSCPMKMNLNLPWTQNAWSVFSVSFHLAAADI